ncbi:hypothetical protein KI387_012928, partial [Taxus chinensis]
MGVYTSTVVNHGSVDEGVIDTNCDEERKIMVFGKNDEDFRIIERYSGGSCDGSNKGRKGL